MTFGLAQLMLKIIITGGVLFAVRSWRFADAVQSEASGCGLLKLTNTGQAAQEPKRHD
jgi:hypothetical protein